MPHIRDTFPIARRLLAALLLTLAVWHAAVPFSQSFEHATGSAFSAGTADVSLACGQPAAVAKRTLPSNPFVPIFAIPIAATAIVAPLACQTHLTGEGQTGPPVFATTLSPLAPRAPPAA